MYLKRNKQYRHHYHDEEGNEVVLKDGQSITVSWPDGTRTTEIVCVKTKEKGYNDNRGDWRVLSTYEKYFILATLHKLVIQIPIERVEIINE